MPKIVNKKKKKEEIILAAIDAFYRCGVEKSSMKNIADSMGMGRSSLYSYFNNREEILNEMVLYTINKFNKTLQSKLFSKTMPVSEKIVRMFTNIFYEDEHVTKSVSVIIEYLVLIRREGKNHVHHLDKFTDHISKLFGTLLEQGVEEGEFVYHNIEQMAYVLYALLESLIIRGAYNFNNDTPIDKNAIQMILNGIKQSVQRQEVLI